MGWLHDDDDDTDAECIINLSAIRTVVVGSVGMIVLLCMVVLYSNIIMVVTTAILRVVCRSFFSLCHKQTAIRMVPTRIHKFWGSFFGLSFGHFQ